MQAVLASSYKEIQMRSLFCSALLVMIISCPALGGDIDRRAIPGDTKWVVHIDFETLAKTQMGQALYESATRQEPNAEAIADSIGFVPLQDLHSITVFDSHYGPSAGVALIRGRVEGEKLVTLLQTLAACREIDHLGKTVYGFTYPALGRWDERFGCLVGDDGVLLAQSLDALTAVLDVLEQRSAAIGDDQLVELAAPAGKAFLRAYTSEMPAIRQSSSQAAMLQRVKSGYFEVGESDGNLNATAKMTAISADDAVQIRMFIDGLVSFGRMSMSTSQSSSQPVWVSMLKDISVKDEKETVTISLSTPVENILGMVGQLVRVGVSMAQP